MSGTAREIAVAQQRLASDPEVSSFVSASAGSGKTKLLTDRLLRLMLAGAAPGRIQCLTYTKAAAAEMADSDCRSRQPSPMTARSMRPFLSARPAAARDQRQRFR